MINSFEEYQETYRQSIDNPEGFWEKIANTFSWKQKYDSVLEWNFEEPKVKWFVNGKLNITENCIDRHLQDKSDKVAIIWEPNDPGESERKITYKELLSEVSKVANALRSSGIKKGDRVCLYMPMIPELAFSVLACARIGAIHSVVFAGFSHIALADRINDASCKMVITADGSFRGSKTIPLKSVVDKAIVNCSSVEKCIVVKRTGTEVSIEESRDIWWDDFLAEAGSECPSEEMDAEDPLFILYTSGSTGKPKGVVHTTGGYMVYTKYSFENVFQYKPGDVYWCTADIGWITGHSYLIYGPLLAGATSIMFEGVPTFPDAGRFWQVVEKYGVNIFYTAPTAIRSLEAKGLEYVTPYDLDSLKVLGTVGEPINVEAWNWYNDNIGKGKCPIVDTWWQTETGGVMISPIAGVTPTKPGYATLPLPGVQPIIVDEEGKELEGNNVEGRLCIKFPWPSMLRTTYADHKRCYDTYFAPYAGYYFTGDGCRRDEDGYYRITGRVDDVINVSGHLLGTAEIENAINKHDSIVESAVVGYPHKIKGWGIYAYVIPESDVADKEKVYSEIKDTVSNFMGPIAKPDKIQLVNDLPKTRSGKIMRRILRKIAEGDTSSLGDTSTLLDPSVVDKIKKEAIEN